MKERDIQRAILDYLAAKGVLAFRMNSGAMSATYNGKKRFMRFGAPGMADVLAFPQDGEGLISTRVIPTWIECKAPKGKQSELQRSFQQQVEAHHHRYILARDVSDVMEAL